MSLRVPVFASVAAALLAGCAVGPNYKRPDTLTPSAYRDQTAGGAGSLADLAWWDLYSDPRLTELVRASLANGFDARIAAARVEQASAIAAEVHGQLFPGVGYTGAADRGRNTILGSPNTQGGGTTGDGFYGYLGAAWEFDIWGRVRRLDEAARAEYLATEQARRGVRLSLVSNVATAYFELLELDEEKAIATEAVASYGQSLDLFNRRLEGGVSSRLETSSAEAARASSAARIPEIERQIAIKENQISVLVGLPPGAVPRGSRLADHLVPPDVPAGLPSSLLERRPDVLEAEYAARSANAAVGVTVGGFLPRIGLSALLGSVSSSLDNITKGSSRLWSAGANVSGPLFQGGGLKGQYEASKAQWEAAKLQYQQTALNAFADVANALVNRQKLAEVRVQQEKAVASYREAVELAKKRYEAGKASYFEVLQAQQALYPAESALAVTRMDQLGVAVQLYKALGGGWSLSEADWSAAGR